MASNYTNRVHNLNANQPHKVEEFLQFLKQNKAKVMAYEREGDAGTHFAVLTRYRNKKEKK